MKEKMNYKCHLDIFQYKILWNMPTTLKDLAEVTGYTYLRARQIILMFEKQGLIHIDKAHKHKLDLTQRGKLVMQLLENVYKEIEI